MQDEIQDEAASLTTGELTPPEGEATAEAQGDTATAQPSTTTEVPPTAFKVKLTRKPSPPDQRVTLFSYVDGERYDHFDASTGDTFEKEFDDLSKARTFIDGAIDSGGFTVADDSPVKLKA